MRFWTTLQHPFHQAVLVENGKIIQRIPKNPPQTIVRRSGPVGEYNGKLAVCKHASFELWDRNGNECLLSYHHPLIYAPHRVVQYQNDLLVCSSGLDLFFIMDIAGNVKWEWWGCKYGMADTNPYFKSDNWLVHQATSDQAMIPVETRAHFNSVWLDGDSFLTSALKKQRIIRIRPYEEDFEQIAWTEDGGVHSPILHNGMLIYGTSQGIKVGDERVFVDMEWVKFIQKTEDGFAFTHERGVTLVDDGWNEIETVSLPRPFQFAFLEK